MDVDRTPFVNPAVDFERPDFSYDQGKYSGFNPMFAGNEVAHDKAADWNWLSLHFSPLQSSLQTGGTLNLSGSTLSSPRIFGAVFPDKTQGSVLFIGSGGLLAENNASFFWDSGNSFLGLGTSTPLAPLDSRGSGTFFAGIGEGTPLGNPVGTITTVAAAGGLTGTFKYIYYEVDGDNGGAAANHTGYSPVTTVVAVANQYTVTVPYSRKGTFGRVLCRTKAGGSTYFVLKDFGQGTEYHNTVFVDNTADAALTVAAPADTDTTRCWDLEINRDVRYIRAHPVSSSAVADVTVLCGDSSNANSFAIHAYNTITSYTGLGNNFHSVHSGVSGTNGHLYCRFQPDIGDGASYTDVFVLRPRGEYISTPFAWTSGTPNLFKITGPAHTGLTASTEANDFYLAFNRTVTWAAGAIATQRAFRIEGPTYAFASASTITDAYTAYIGSAPAAGSNATITRSWALGVVGDAEFQGTVQLGSGANHCSLAGSSGNMTCSGQIRTKNGTAASPGYSFAVDGTCGFYSSSATDYRFSIGSTDVYRLIASGFILPDTSTLQFGSSGIASPDVKVGRDAAGSMGISGLPNGQKFSISSKTELTTIAAAATTDTVITIPVDAVVFAVSVRVTVVIPTAATFTVTGTTSGTQFDVAGGVAVAANTTDVGTRNCPYKNGAAQTIRITPNINPAANTGRVRVTIHYYNVTPATS